MYFPYPTIVYMYNVHVVFDEVLSFSLGPIENQFSLNCGEFQKAKSLLNAQTVDGSSTELNIQKDKACQK